MKPRAMVLSESELEKLKTFMKKCNKDEYKRALAIIQRNQGIPHRRIASMLGIHYRTVFTWVKQYKKIGIEGLKNKPHPGKKPRIGRKEKKIIAEIALKSPKAF
jgi:transposase